MLDCTGTSSVGWTDICAVVVDVITPIAVFVAEQDFDPVPDGFVDHLHEFELDDLAYDQAFDGFEADTPPTQVRAHRGIKHWMTVHAENAHRQAGHDAILLPAVGRDGKLSCSKAGFGRI